MPPPIPRWNLWSLSHHEGVVPSGLRKRRPSPYSNRVGFHIGLFRGLLSVHSRCGLPARRTAKAARCLEGFDGFVTSAAAPIATGWSDQLSGRESHPLKIRAFSRRTATDTPAPRARWENPSSTAKRRRSECYSKRRFPRLRSPRSWAYLAPPCITSSGLENSKQRLQKAKLGDAVLRAYFNTNLGGILKPVTGLRHSHQPK
jgi:hypothetical protein